MKGIIFIVIVFSGCTLTHKQNPGEASGQVTQDPVDSLSVHLDSTAKSGSKSADIFKTYCNKKFGFCIEYPADIFIRQIKSENGNGCVLKDSSGQGELHVFGRRIDNENGGVTSIVKLYNKSLIGEMAPNGTEDFIVTYKKLGENYFVIYGYADGKFYSRKIFYQKTIVKAKVSANAIIVFDELQKERFKAVTERILRSFK